MPGVGLLYNDVAFNENGGRISASLGARACLGRVARNGEEKFSFHFFLVKHCPPLW